MKLLNYLKPEYIAVGLSAQSKEELLTKMVDLASKNPHVLDKEKVRSAILERERIMSTGVGKGFAIPHGKTDAVNDIVLAFATTSDSVDYASMDNEPVRLVLLLVSRDSDVGSRLKLLSRASKVMNSDAARKSLIEAKTADEVLAIFKAEEERIGE
ncbi:MAG: PTS sugar transporter subunit IIA [Bacteroidota bacterium]|nr:PTS sugar transporter subunit IIA [Bacteroidota bacterium]MDP4230196.1 PTS sugar transporter subunit IIA [Bacteroidota bacterium]MDP4237627.1 PTS sugar transporter subunit IIA [Bacteroidota bacterium]